MQPVRPPHQGVSAPTRPRSAGWGEGVQAPPGPGPWLLTRVGVGGLRLDLAPVPGQLCPFLEVYALGSARGGPGGRNRRCHWWLNL